MVRAAASVERAAMVVGMVAHRVVVGSAAAARAWAAAAEGRLATAARPVAAGAPGEAEGAGREATASEAAPAALATVEGSVGRWRGGAAAVAREARSAVVEAAQTARKQRGCRRRCIGRRRSARSTAGRFLP